MKKKSILMWTVLSMTMVLSFSGLLEDFDKLSPEEAMQFRHKINNYTIEGESDDGGAGGVFLQFITPKKLNAAFPGTRGVGNVVGMEIEGLVTVDKNISIGGRLSGAGNFVSNESSSRIYEDILLGFGAAQFLIDYKIAQSNSFVLKTSVGLGAMVGGYNYAKTNDNPLSEAHYVTERWGLGLCSSIDLDAIWISEDGWGGGIGIGYFSGKINNLNRIIVSDGSAPELDLSGANIKLFVSKKF